MHTSVKKELKTYLPFLFFSFFLLLPFVYPTMLWSESTNSLPHKSYEFYGQFGKMVLSVIALMGVVVFTTWILKRMMDQKLRFLNRSNKIKVMEKRSLNPKSSLYIVEVENQRWLVSESPAGIHRIGKLDQSNL